MSDKPKILVVDDEQINLTLAQRILAAQDYEVLTASSGAEALNLLETVSEIDVMLLDMKMSDISGLNVLEAIKRNPCTAGIKVIMLSAMNDVQDKVDAFSFGAADYIIKPFKKEELLVRIETQLELGIVEKALRKAKEQAEQLYRIVPSAIFTVDTTGLITSFNNKAAEVLGYAPEEIIGQPCKLFALSPCDHKCGLFSQDVTKPIQGRECAIKTKAGQTRAILKNAELLRDNQGQIIGGIESFEDITELKQAMEELRKLSRAVEQSGSAIVITDLNGAIEFVNPAFSAITGYSSEEALGQNPRLLKSGHQPAALYKNLWDTLGRGEVWAGELRNKKKNGELFWEWATISPVKDKTGKTTHYLAVKENITERKQVEEELHRAKEEAEAATQAKSDFLATMSHEIRTPMNGIIGMTSLLLDTPLTPEQRDYVETIRHSGDALLTIINDILDFSKIEANKMELENQPFDLRECVEQALDLIAPRAGEKGLDLAYTIDPRLPETFVKDVTRLRQILINLLSNAVKFTEKGEIVVSVTGEKLDNEVYKLSFAVKDSGIGIPPDRLNRLFQSFSQVDASTTRRYGGTGLGLAICKRLSEMMDGAIGVKSKAGEGSIFYFTIKAQTSAEHIRRYVRGPQAELTNKRILIVDDNETNRRILSHQTASWGMLPTAVASGPQALDLLYQPYPFDLAILDMQMPDMDGLTLAAEIRKSCALPLIMLTSLGYREHSQNGVKFAAYLTKPIKPSQLYDALAEVFAEPSAALEKITPQVSKFDRHLGQEHPLRILLAEDNVVNQKVALSILERLGYRADVAANGQEALQSLERQAYDVILMDAQMPEMDGLEATRQIRQRWPQAQQPHIIALTANALQGDRERFLSAGMDDYVSKPIQIEELTRALSEAPPSKTQPAPGHANGKVNSSTTPYVLTPVSPKPAPELTSTPAPPLDNAPATALAMSLMTKAIDYTVLETFQTQLGDGAAEVMTQLVGLFLEDAPKLLTQLQQAANTGKAEEIRRHAHTLKSNSATFGAMPMSALCADLEKQSKAGFVSGAGVMAAQIQQQFNLARVELERYCAAGAVCP